MMKSLEPSVQGDMFPVQTASGASKARFLVLEYLGPIPSYKNNKMLVPVSAKRLKTALETGDLGEARLAFRVFQGKRPLLITKPEFQEQMENIIRSFASQLRSAAAIASGPTCPESSIRSWIASSVPADDAWTYIPKIVIEGELCEPGQEGATIVIERLS